MATKKKTQTKRQKAQQTRKEVWGVVLSALGLFLGVCIYFDAVGIVGKAVTGALFGLSGWFCYALPAALLTGGIVLIAVAGQKPRKGRVALVLLGVLFILTLLQVIARPLLGDMPYLPYLKDAYLYGRDAMAGGGALGAVLTYPLLLLTGEAGAYIFLIAGILIILLLVTSLSLKRTGEQAAQMVKTGIQHANERREARRQMLYNEDLKNPVAPALRTQPKKKTAPVRPRPVNPVRRDENRPDVAFLPQNGPIEKKKKMAAELPLEEVDTLPVMDEPPFEEEEVLPIDELSPLFEEPDEPDDFVLPNVTPLREPKAQTGEAFIPRSVMTGEAPAQPGLSIEEPEQEATVLPFPQQERPYVPPAFSLLNASKPAYMQSTEDPQQTGKLLIDTLASFNVSAKLMNVSVGPVITRFELQPAPGVRVNKITALSDDIALALAAPRVRIEAPIPGKAAVGIEIPNKDTATVVLRDIVESPEFSSAKSPITMALGKDIAGKVIVADLAKMPHLLIAGATGSGKSVCINDIVISLVYKSSPKDLQLILVDPKVVELSVFANLPHLKLPVVTDPKKAAGALCGAVKEMTDRYRKFASLGARDLARYNELQEKEENKLPKLVIIIDELADLMMVAPDTVEDSICRIAQLGRACGIHLIVATQRPSADIITGLIKANIPSRIAFAVSSAIDSRIILDAAGAEKLLGRGDMLFHPNGSGKPTRVQGAFVSDEEVERIARHFQNQQMAPQFDESLIEDIESSQEGGPAQGNGKQEDELLGEAVRIVLDSGQASISMIQRRLRVGYARAARLVDIMEQHGYVSGFDGSKPRKVLITRAQYESTFGEGAKEEKPAPTPLNNVRPGETIPAGTLYGTSALVKEKPQTPPSQKDLADYADDDPDAPWARKPGEAPPWEEEPLYFDDDDE